MGSGNSADHRIAEYSRIRPEILRLAADGLCKGDVAPHGGETAREMSAGGAAENSHFLRVDLEFLGAHAYLIEYVRGVHQRLWEALVAAICNHERGVSQREVL